MVKKIAITGGIGSGKSLVLECIKELGYPVFSCDMIYKELLQTPKFARKIAELFPSCVKNNEIDRKELGNIVFNNKEQLETLNKLSHPVIMETLYERMDKCGNKIAFAEVPLLFEGGFEKDFHETIFVKRDIEERIKAIILRDKINEESALQRIRAQFNPNSKVGAEKLSKSNVFILDNNSNIENIKKQLTVFLKKFA